jgi:hypothetical protein
MACPSHRLTTAQVRAGFPLHPALIWTAANDEEDTLSSNGIPAWYDEDGQDHAAPAWTWKHRATGRRGGPAPRVDTAYLPLNPPTSRDCGQLPVIDLLRDSRNAAAHWVVIDIGADTHLIRPDAVRQTHRGSHDHTAPTRTHRREAARQHRRPRARCR